MSDWTGRRLHFVGIGGAGMSGLALVARALGAEVTGSDRAAGSPYAATLRAAGDRARGRPRGRQRARRAPRSSTRARSGPTTPSAPSRERELHRADLLGELTRLKPTIAVTGTHGKTTTSSMIVHALLGCGLDPSYLVGGEVRSTGTNAAWGAGEWLVVEADESDRSLLKLSPRDRGAHERRARPPHDLRLQRDVDETFRAFLASAAPRSSGIARELLRAGRGPGDLRRRRAARPAGLGVRVRRRDGRARPAGAAQRPERRGGADRAPAGGGRRARGRARAGLLHRRRAALRAARHDRVGRARRRRLRPSPDRGAGDDRRRAHAGARPASSPSSSRTCSRARRARRASSAPRWRTADRSWSCEIYPRASAPRTSPASPGCSSPRRPPTPRGGRPVAWMPGFDAAGAYLRAELREGDLCLTLGAGDVDSLGPPPAGRPTSRPGRHSRGPGLQVEGRAE